MGNPTPEQLAWREKLWKQHIFEQHRGVNTCSKSAHCFDALLHLAPRLMLAAAADGTLNEVGSAAHSGVDGIQLR